MNEQFTSAADAVQASVVSENPPAFVSENSSADVEPTPPTGKRKYKRKNSKEVVPVSLSPEDAELSFKVYSRLGAMAAKLVTDLNAVRIGGLAKPLGMQKDFEALVTPSQGELDMFGQCAGELAKIYNLSPKHGPLSGMFVLAAGYVSQCNTVTKEIRALLEQHKKSTQAMV